MRKLLKHFLTIERLLKHLHLIQERCYFFNKNEIVVIEKIYHYSEETADRISELDNEKTSDVNSFMINLEVMIDHPGVTYKDEKFIKWYADQIEQGKFDS